MRWPSSGNCIDHNRAPHVRLIHAGGGQAKPVGGATSKTSARWFCFIDDESELERALRLSSRFIGINNRNLKTFETTLETSERLAPLVPDGYLVVGESGLAAPQDLARLSRAGIDTFLIGESLMRQADVETATRNLLRREAAAATIAGA